jgi:hypothetical protein
MFSAKSSARFISVKRHVFIKTDGCVWDREIFTLNFFTKEFTFYTARSRDVGLFVTEILPSIGNVESLKSAILSA